jgi:hypothetical protein
MNRQRQQVGSRVDRPIRLDRGQPAHCPSFCEPVLVRMEHVAPSVARRIGAGTVPLYPHASTWAPEPTSMRRSSTRISISRTEPGGKVARGRFAHPKPRGLDRQAANRCRRTDPGRLARAWWSDPRDRGLRSRRRPPEPDAGRCDREQSRPGRRLLRSRLSSAAHAGTDRRWIQTIPPMTIPRPRNSRYTATPPAMNTHRCQAGIVLLPRM